MFAREFRYAAAWMTGAALCGLCGGEELVLRILGPDGAPQSYAQIGRYIDWSYAAEPTVQSMAPSFAPYSDDTGTMRIRVGDVLSESEGSGVRVPMVIVGGDLASMAIVELERGDFTEGDPRETRLAEAAELRGAFRARDEDGNIVDPGGGTVQARIGDFTIAGAALKADGTYLLRLPPGSYILEAQCWLESGTAAPISRELTAEEGPLDLDLEFKAEGVGRGGPAPTLGWPLPELTAVGAWRGERAFAAGEGVAALLFWSDLSPEGMASVERLAAIQGLFGLLGVRVAAIYAGEEDGAAVEAALAAHEAAARRGVRLPFPVGWDTSSSIGTAFRLPGTPAFLVTDRDGNVTSIESGGGAAEKAVRSAALAPKAIMPAFTPPPMPMPIPTGTPAAPLPETAPPWWEPFTALYTLEPGRDVKYLYPPYAAARADFFAASAPGAPAPSFMILSEEKRTPGAWPVTAYAYGKTLPLEMLLNHAVGLRPWQIDAPPELLARDVMGDWVFRETAGVEAALRGIAAVLRETFALPVSVTAAEAPRPVLVVQGKGGAAVDVQDAAEEAKGARLCKQLEILLGVPVENAIRISYGAPPGAAFGVPPMLEVGPDIASEAGRQAFLDTLARQTVLEFRFEEKPVPVWRFALER